MGVYIPLPLTWCC